MAEEENFWQRALQEAASKTAQYAPIIDESQKWLMQNVLDMNPLEPFPETLKEPLQYYVISRIEGSEIIPLKEKAFHTVDFHGVLQEYLRGRSSIRSAYILGKLHLLDTKIEWWVSHSPKPSSPGL